VTPCADRLAVAIQKKVNNQPAVFMNVFCIRGDPPGAVRKWFEANSTSGEKTKSGSRDSRRTRSLRLTALIGFFFRGIPLGTGRKQRYGRGANYRGPGRGASEVTAM
jgi:hypothetical protein